MKRIMITMALAVGLQVLPVLAVEREDKPKISKVIGVRGLTEHMLSFLYPKSQGSKRGSE